LAPVNTKRIYRLMKKHGLLLERHTGRRRLREHDGQVATIRNRPPRTALRCGAGSGW
jgi:putative transposase